MSSFFDLVSSKPLMASRQTGGLKSMKAVINGLKKSKTDENYLPPALRCRGSLPPTPSEQCVRDLDRILNPDLLECEGFSEVIDEDICPIDYDDDYEVVDGVNPQLHTLKSASAWAHSFPNVSPSGHSLSKVKPVDFQRHSAKRGTSKDSRSAQVVTCGPDLKSVEAGNEIGDGIRLAKTSQDTLHSDPAPADENQVLCFGRKRPIFQPPPLEEEFTDEEEEQSDSDGWSIIDEESDYSDPSASGEMLTHDHQKAKCVLDHAGNELDSSCPRIHPLFAAKYGSFFQFQSQ